MEWRIYPPAPRISVLTEGWAFFLGEFISHCFSLARLVIVLVEFVLLEGSNSMTGFFRDNNRPLFQIVFNVHIKGVIPINNQKSLLRL
jgi:hypothetical protein